MDDWKFIKVISVNAAFSMLAFYFTYRLIPGLSDMFIRKNMFGIDMSKKIKSKM